jgi:hypothetical protein
MEALHQYSARNTAEFECWKYHRQNHHGRSCTYVSYETSWLSLQPPAHAGSPIADFSTLKMEAIRSSETSGDTRSTQRHIPEDDILHSHRCESLKSYKIIFALHFLVCTCLYHISRKSAEQFWSVMWQTQSAHLCIHFMEGTHKNYALRLC